MIYAKAIPYGLDATIKRLQQHLDTYLSLIWAGTFEIFGKIQRTETESGIIPEAYSSGNEYIQVFVNDNVACTIGFDLIDRTIDSVKKATVDVIFTLNLEEIHEDTLRNDEKALLEAQKVIEKSGLTKVILVKEGIKEVFSNFQYENIKYRDMQPWQVFSFRCELMYFDNLC